MGWKMDSNETVLLFILKIIISIRIYFLNERLLVVQNPVLYQLTVSSNQSSRSWSFSYRRYLVAVQSTRCFLQYTFVAYITIYIYKSTTESLMLHFKLLGNYYSDACLVAAGGKTLGKLDFYQIPTYAPLSVSAPFKIKVYITIGTIWRDLIFVCQFQL